MVRCLCPCNHDPLCLACANGNCFLQDDKGNTWNGDLAEAQEVDYAVLTREGA